MPKGSKKRRNERRTKESLSAAADTHQEVIAEAKLPPVVNKLIKSSSASSIGSTKEDTSLVEIVKPDDKIPEVTAEQLINGIDSENTKDFVNLNKDSVDNSDVVVMSHVNDAAISEPVAKVEELSILPNITPEVEVIAPAVEVIAPAVEVIATGVEELSEPNQSDVARKQQLENIMQKLQEALFGVQKLIE